MERRRPKQLALPAPRTWGGRRAGAGRKPAFQVRPGPRHRRRPEHDSRHPVHVTLRARPAVPSLRSNPAFGALLQSLSRSSGRSLRVTQFSVQTDHIHLIVEADTATALSHGVHGLAVRTARAVNRAAQRRGPVWIHRYHAHPLRSPREVRHALVYVLLNFRKHLRAAPGVDPRSSGPWFDGWAHTPPAPAAAAPVAPSRTWLGTVGWRRVGGAIHHDEAPAAPRRPPAPRQHTRVAKTSVTTG